MYKDKEKEKAYKRRYYLKNRQSIVKKNRENIRVRKDKATAFINRVKSKFGCSKCGYNRCVSVLHFHHLSGKDHSVARLRRDGRSIELIKKEIRKCVILCANCHGEVHAGFEE